MAGVDAKGRTVILGSELPNEVRVINGAVLVKLISRGTPREGYGSAQLLDGIAAKGEVRIINGAVRVKVV